MRTPHIPVLALLLAFAPDPVDAQTVFLGSEVSPLGDANLSIGSTRSRRTSLAPAGNRLYVGNLSFSGDDGFRMHIGGGSGAVVQSLDLGATLPVGGEIVFEVSNGLGINPCCHVGHVGASLFETTPDATTFGNYDVTVLNDGAAVANYSAMSGPVSASMAPMEFRADLLSLAIPLPDPYSLPASEPFPISEAFSLRWSSDVMFMDSAGGSLGTGDELMFIPASPLGLGSVDHVDVKAMVPAGLPPMTLGVDDLAQQFHGHSYRNRNNDSIIAADINHRAKLMIPAGMQGSLQADMDPAETGLHLMWTTPGGAFAGDTDELTATGELLTGGVEELGKVIVLCNGTSWDVTPDFSASGSPDAAVELLDDSGHVLGINPSTMGPITVMTTQWAILTGVEDNNIGLEIGFPAPVPMNLPGVGMITASRIKMHSNASRRYLYFASVGRAMMSSMGGDFIVDADPNMMQMSELTSMPEFTCRGTLTGKRQHGPIMLHSSDPGGTNGVDVMPAGAPDQFGVQWAPLGPPSATVGETDWAFVSRLATDTDPVERMRVRLVSDGTAVHVYKDPGPINTPEFQVILKDGGVVVAEFMHSSDADPIVELADWPIAVGYKLLGAPDEPWSMWIDLGYEMDFSIPGGASTASDIAALPIAKADLIEVIALNTSNPGPPQETMLTGSFADVPYIVVDTNDPHPVGVSGTPRRARSVLRPAYPNPFNPQTTLAFELRSGGEVSLMIYAIDGSYVATVYRGVLSAGSYAYPWNGLDHRGQRVASGVYLARLQTPDGNRSAKLNLLK
ncbi:MAG TPA: T9SS type A sorting domain-containing protein [Candidatus Krumholzibacteria bacterium]|nr:T9SS type A sorting domain-containing protein [Candidatus Krumholzibacteria bacterium]